MTTKNTKASKTTTTNTAAPAAWARGDYSELCEGIAAATHAISNDDPPMSYTVEATVDRDRIIVKVIPRLVRVRARVE